MESIRLTAERMLKSKRPADVAVLGYSLWFAYRSGAQHFDFKSKRKFLQDLDNLDLPSAMTGGSIEGIKWDDMVAPGVFDQRFHPPARDFPKVEIGRVAGNSVYQAPKEEGFTFDLFASTEAGLMSARARLAAPFYNGLVGVGLDDCRMDWASVDFDRTLETLLRISREVVVYLTPTTPLQTDSVPPCFRQSVVEMLKSKAGPRVLVETGDWRSYGLDYPDFLMGIPDEGVVRLDVNHVNYLGSKKVSAKVAGLIREARLRGLAAKHDGAHRQAAR